MVALRDHATANETAIVTELPIFNFQMPNDTEFQLLLEDPEHAFMRFDPISVIYTYFRYLLWLGSDAFKGVEALQLPSFRISRKQQADPDLIPTMEAHWAAHLSLARGSTSAVRRSTQLDCAKLFKCTGSSLEVLGLQLDHNDDPVEVFSALNGNRLELTQFDLLRNMIYAKLGEVDIEHREDIYTQYWEDVERLMLEVPTGRGRSLAMNQSDFFYDYLISVGASSTTRFNAKRSFLVFQRYYLANNIEQSLESWIKHLRDEVKIWRIQRYEFNYAGPLPSGNSFGLTLRAQHSIARIRYASAGPPTPLVMFILRRSVLPPNDPRAFTPQEVERVLRSLEGYMFKTLLAGDSLTNLRAEVIGKMGDIDKKCVRKPGTTASRFLIDELKRLTSYRWDGLAQRLKTDFESLEHDEEVADGVYKSLRSRPTLALLDAINEEIAGGGVQSLLETPASSLEPPFWVEHIFPQSPREAWIRNLRSWHVKSIDMRARTHSLGNLTAIPAEVDVAISNKSFHEKKAMLAKAQEEGQVIPGNLNRWRSSTKWTPEAIDRRTSKFVVALKKKWPDPR
jgi:hypothetical protein